MSPMLTGWGPASVVSGVLSTLRSQEACGSESGALHRMDPCRQLMVDHVHGIGVFVRRATRQDTCQLGSALLRTCSRIPARRCLGVQRCSHRCIRCVSLFVHCYKYRMPLQIQGGWARQGTVKWRVNGPVADSGWMGVCFARPMINDPPLTGT